MRHEPEAAVGTSQNFDVLLGERISQLIWSYAHVRGVNEDDIAFDRLRSHHESQLGESRGDHLRIFVVVVHERPNVVDRVQTACRK